MKLGTRSLAVVVAALPFLAMSAIAETTENTAKAVETTAAFDNWQVLCTGDQNCRMAQTIIQPSTKRLILQIKVFGGDDPTVLLTFPLGILLSTGWQYDVDGGKPTVLPFEICNEEGCYVGVKLSPELKSAMARGRTLRVRFFDAAREEVVVEASLMGFTQAYAALR